MKLIILLAHLLMSYGTYDSIIIKDSSCPSEVNHQTNTINLLPDADAEDRLCMWYMVDVSSYNFSSIPEIENAFYDFPEDHFEIRVVDLTRVDLFLKMRLHPEYTFDDWNNYVKSINIHI